MSSISNRPDDLGHLLQQRASPQLDKLRRCSEFSGGSIETQPERLRGQCGILRSHLWSEDIVSTSPGSIYETWWCMYPYMMKMVDSQAIPSSRLTNTRLSGDAVRPGAVPILRPRNTASQMRSVLPHFSSRSLLEPQVCTLMMYQAEQTTSSSAVLSMAFTSNRPADCITINSGEPWSGIVADADGP